MKILKWINDENAVLFPYSTELVAVSLPAWFNGEFEDSKYILPIDDKFAYVVKVLDKEDDLETSTKRLYVNVFVEDVCKYKNKDEDNTLWVKPFKEIAKGQINQPLRRATFNLLSEIIDLYLKDKNFSEAEKEFLEEEMDSDEVGFKAEDIKKVCREMLKIKNLGSASYLAEELAYILVCVVVRFDIHAKLMPQETFNRDYLTNLDLTSRQEYVFNLLLQLINLKVS